ncbi:MAG: glycosyltransferase family 39 protein [Nitrospirota bacterium]
MGNNKPRPDKNNHIFVFSLFSLLTYIFLFIFRSFDDNRLTSWQWVFEGVNAVEIYLLLIIGIIASYFLSRFSFYKRYPSIFLFLISFATAGAFWGEPEVIIDISRYFTQAKHLEMYGIGYFIREWGGDINAWTDMPLVPFLYGLIFKFFGENRLFIQIFTTFLFSMTVVFAYFIGKELWDEEVGFSGGMLLLGVPYLFTQVPLMLIDVPAMFFLAFAVLTFIMAMEKGGMGFISLSSFAISLAFYSKYSTWLMLSVLVVIFVVYCIQRSPACCSSSEEGKGAVGTRKLRTSRYIYRGIAVAFLSSLLVGVVFWYKFDVFSEQMRLLMAYQKPGLKRWGESFVSTFFFQIHPFITLAALYSVYEAAKKRDIKYLIIVWLLLLVVFMQIRRIRYIIMIFPMISLMASYGLQRIRHKDIRRFIVYCAASSSIIIAAFAHLPFMEKISTVNLKNAGKYLNSIGESDVEVFAFLPENPAGNLAVSVPILDLFTNKNIIYEYKENEFRQPPEKTEKSPLRFTWEYKNPEYYENKKYSAGNTAVAVISDDSGDALPENIEKQIKGYRLTGSFNIYDGVFLFRTSVRVYQRK